MFSSFFSAGPSNFIVGGPSGRILVGTTGNDWLYGGLGDDTLIGLDGNDRLYGGRGADTFVFDQTTGNDTVTDFTFGEDRLDLTGTLVTLANLASRTVDDASKGTVIIKLGALDGKGESTSNVLIYGVNQTEFNSLMAGNGVIFPGGGGGGGPTVLSGTPGITDTFTIEAGDGEVVIDGFELGAFEVPADGDILDLSDFGITRDALIDTADGSQFALDQLGGTIYGIYRLDFDPDFLSNFTNVDTTSTADDLTVLITNTVTGDQVTLTLLEVDTAQEIDEALFYHTQNGGAAPAAAVIPEIRLSLGGWGNGNKAIAVPEPSDNSAHDTPTGLSLLGMGNEFPAHAHFHHNIADYFAY